MRRRLMSFERVSWVSYINPAHLWLPNLGRRRAHNRQRVSTICGQGWMSWRLKFCGGDDDDDDAAMILHRRIDMGNSLRFRQESKGSVVIIIQLGISVMREFLRPHLLLSHPAHPIIFWSPSIRMDERMRNSRDFFRLLTSFRERIWVRSWVRSWGKSGIQGHGMQLDVAFMVDSDEPIGMILSMILGAEMRKDLCESCENNKWNFSVYFLGMDLFQDPAVQHYCEELVVAFRLVLCLCNLSSPVEGWGIVTVRLGLQTCDS